MPQELQTVVGFHDVFSLLYYNMEDTNMNPLFICLVSAPGLFSPISCMIPFFFPSALSFGYISVQETGLYLAEGMEMGDSS